MGCAVDRELAEFVDDPVRREEGKEKVLCGQMVLVSRCGWSRRCVPDGRDRADSGGSGTASAGSGTGSAGSAVVSVEIRDVRLRLPTSEAGRAVTYRLLVAADVRRLLPPVRVPVAPVVLLPVPRSVPAAVPLFDPVAADRGELFVDVGRAEGRRMEEDVA
jgi:hypothetical protein